MGDIAESLLSGEFDEYTGEYIGPAVGYPRSMDSAHWSNKQARYNYNYGNNPLGGIEQWVVVNTEIRRPGKVWKAIREYSKLYDIKEPEDQVDKKPKFLASWISQHHWQLFIVWVKETYK